MLLLARDEIHIYVLRFGMQPERFDDPRLLALLSDNERGRHRNFLFEKDKRSFLLSHAMVRLLLAEYSGVAAEHIAFRQNRYGKPFPETNAAACPFFSLTHTGCMATCAVAFEPELGVDVEDTLRQADWKAISESTFAAEECTSLEHAVNRQERFYELWTLKEAYVKARGQGFSLPLNQFSMQMGAEGGIRIVFSPETEDDAADWQFRLYSIETCRLALAVRRKKVNVIVKEVTTLGPPLFARETRIAL